MRNAVEEVKAFFFCKKLVSEVKNKLKMLCAHDCSAFVIIDFVLHIVINYCSWWVFII